MRKIKKVSLILCFILMVSIITTSICKSSIKERKISYKIDKYNIDEKFYMNGKEHNYDIIVSNKKDKYNYIFTINLSKSKKIIKKIEEYKRNNLKCIIPIYKKSDEKNIYCILNNEQVSIDYLLKTGNEDFKIIQKKIKKYKIEYPNSDDNFQEYKKIKIYNNIDDKEIIYIWNYKGIYIIEKENIRYKKILNYDLYDGIVSVTLNNNFILFENNSVSGIKNIYYYNYKKDKINKIKVKEKISKEIYINGINDNLIYFTDTKYKKEYTLDIKKEKIEQIDNNQTEYVIYINDKKKILSKSDFFMKTQLFDNYDTIYNEYNAKEDGKYFYYLSDNDFYIVNKNSKVKTLLYNIENIKEWNIINENIYIISDDSLYRYNDKKGLNKIITDNELKYNYKNIIKIGKKI